MKTTPVNDNLIQLTRWGFVNAYLVREDDGFTLVDTTMPKTGDALIAAARAAGAPIRRIALTHGHGDHVGSLDELKAKLGDEVAGADARARRPDPRRRAGRRGQAEGQLADPRDRARRSPDARRSGRQPRGGRRAPATRPATSRSSTPATVR